MTEKTAEATATETIADLVPNEFRAAFQVTKTIMFEVRYNTLGGNAAPYFSTEAARLNTRRTDYSECGQCQERLLPKGSVARKFWEKWDAKHLDRLSDDERKQMWDDLGELRCAYNHLLLASDKFGTEDRRDIRFDDVVALSKKKLPRRRGAA